MRKYFNLQIDKEEFDIKMDNSRLDLISHQILREVQDQHYHLTYKEYCHFAALNFLTKVGCIFHNYRAELSMLRY
jgi:hypothetical protein